MAGTFRSTMSYLTSLSTDRLRGRGVVRSADEEHRAATPLELFFDLTFVVAIGRAAAALHHELVAGHVADGLLGFTMGFFACWWGWMNYTWFASAHDADDVPHRLLTLLQMAGVLVLASGISSAVETGEFAVPTIGYGIMRLGLVLSWLRVARDEPATRDRALRYAAGLTLLQVLWFLRLALPEEAAVVTFFVLGLAELALPYWAERTGDRPLFHPEHIEERYGLFTIIVLGESIISASAGLQTALDEVGLTADVALIGFSALILAFGAWWIYFDHPGHLAPAPEVAFRWGYAHVVVFASLAAMGAGVHVAVDAVLGHGSERTASLAVALPVAGYLLGLALIIRITGRSLGSVRVAPKLVGAAAAVAVGLVLPPPAATAGCAVVVLLLTLAMVMTQELTNPQTG